jgi:hypothetical protein
MNLHQTLKTMNATYQLKNKISVLDHGQMVKERLWDLISILEGKVTILEWKLPPNFLNYKDFLKSQLAERSSLYLYTVMHDCGKPSCKIIDKNG